MRERSTARYPRTARVNEMLREVIAEALESVDDRRLALVTVTGVVCDPDLRHATVYWASLAADTDGVADALEDARKGLQKAIGSQVRMKRTPVLSFALDPARVTGQRIEDVLRDLPELHEPTSPASGSSGSSGGSGEAGE